MSSAGGPRGIAELAVVLFLLLEVREVALALALALGSGDDSMMTRLPTMLETRPMLMIGSLGSSWIVTASTGGKSENCAACGMR